MKDKIVAKDKKHLKKIIQNEIKLNGNDCDLNHIDVSNVTDMSSLFCKSEFNGNISQWDVSKVELMDHMFNQSKFNGDIGNWNTSNVITMSFMFYMSEFNGYISQWDVSKVKTMNGMFLGAKFNQDISIWKPYRLEAQDDILKDCPAPVPYWLKYEVKYDHSPFTLEPPSDEIYKERRKAIDTYHLAKELNNELSQKNNSGRKIKI
jgi:surface protein